MMKPVGIRKIILAAAGLALCQCILATVASAKKNDLPSGAQQVEPGDPSKKPIWWKGFINYRGDIDWYRFEMKEPGTLLLAFERPPGKEFSCGLYAGGDTEKAIAEVKAGEIGAPFAGYTEVKIEKGTHYLKMEGDKEHFNQGKDQYYLFALELPKKGGGGGGADQQKQPQQQQPTPQPAKELNQQEAKDLLKKFEREQRDPTHFMETQISPVPETVDRDW